MRLKFAEIAALDTVSAHAIFVKAAFTVWKNIEISKKPYSIFLIKKKAA